MACTGGGGFDAAKHVWVIGTSCPYACKPYVYQDSPRQCNTPCTDLWQAVLAGSIKRRVREYTTGTQRPHYELGQCGTTDTFPTSDVPLLRRARWGALMNYAQAVCGNALLETGEECDDGNAVSGDGCSAACKLEVASASYWDCDLIGAPCLPNCGWSTQATDAWGIGLRGFLLPACTGGVCACKGMSYYEVSQLPVNERRGYMFRMFVSCNCGGNLQRMLPYQVCLSSFSFLGFF